jgi:molybdopterin-guanine dinucleotide biosynthesis protein A
VPAVAWVELIDRLAEWAGVAVGESPRGVEPLLARYPPDVLGFVRETLARGEPVRSAIARIQPELVRIDDDLLNVNTPDDLERAGALGASS